MLERFLGGGRSGKKKKSGQNADIYAPYGGWEEDEIFASGWDGRLPLYPPLY